MCTSKLPGLLEERYHELLRRHEAASAQVRKLTRELKVIAQALRAVDPAWEPPAYAAKKQSPSRLQPGVVARDSVKLLRQAGRLSTPDIAKRIAETRRLKFVDNEDWLDFCSTVAMALRRYERKGFLHIASRDPKSGALTWSIADDGKAVQAA